MCTSTRFSYIVYTSNIQYPSEPLSSTCPWLSRFKSSTQYYHTSCLRQPAYDQACGRCLATPTPSVDIRQRRACIQLTTSGYSSVWEEQRRGMYEHFKIQAPGLTTCDRYFPGYALVLGWPVLAAAVVQKNNTGSFFSAPESAPKTRSR